MPLIVEVTYGTRPHQVYSTVQDVNGKPDRETAEAHVRLAKSLGYSDARIVDEEDFREAQDASRGGAPRARGTYRRAA
jgi:hypothetical protein